MAITLRNVKGSALTHSELDANFTDITSSMVYSGSISGTTLTLHKSGSSIGIDLSGLGGAATPTGSLMVTGSVSSNTLTFTKGDGSTFDLAIDSLYNADGTLTSARTVTADSNNLTFDMSTANFQITTDSAQRVIIQGLSTGNNPQVLGIDPATGAIKAMNTSSIAGGGSATPQGVDSQVQYNNGGSFGGAAIYFDDVNNSVGINVTPYSNRVFAVSSSAGIAMRFQSEQATANRIQFVNASSVGAGVVAGTINGDDFHLQQSDTDLITNLYISSSGEAYLPRIATSSKANVVGFDTATGELTYFSTASFGGGSGTPGGSDTQVQFNDGGAFGGDSGFLYDKTNNKLTVVSAGTGATTNPTIQLGTSDVSIAPGDTVGRISFSNTDSTYGGATSYAAIYAVAPSNWGGGQYPKDVRIAAVASAATVDVATFKGSGVVQLHDYGSGNNTGTAAKWLAVDSSGNMIEENAPSSGADVSRVTPTTTHIFDTKITNNSNYVWNLELGSGAPSGNGKMRIGMTSSTKSASTVTVFEFDRDSSTGNRDVTLNYLQEDGRLILRNTSGTIIADGWDIKEVDTSNANYVRVYVNWTAGSVTLNSGTDYRVDFISDARIPLADASYNNITLQNQSSTATQAVLVANDNSTFGDYTLVEVKSNASNSGDVYVSYARLSEGSTTTFNDYPRRATFLNGVADTVTQLTVASANDVALLEFRVVNFGNLSLALMGCDKIKGS